MKRSFILRFLIDGTGRASMLALIIFLARVLGVDDFGKLTFALSFASIIYTLSEGGIHLPLLRDMGRVALNRFSSEDREGVWKDYLGLKLLLSAGSAILATAVAAQAWPWSRPAILVSVCFWMLSNSLADFFHQTCNAVDHLKTSAIIMASHRGVCILAATVGYLCSKNLFGVSVGLGIGGLLATGAGLLILKYNTGLPLRPGWRVAGWKLRLKDALPLILGSFFWSTYMRLGVLMLPWLGRSSESGYYGAAHKFFEIGYMVPAALMSVAVPRLSRSLADNPSLMGRDFRRLLKYVLGMSAAGLIAGELLAPFLVRMLYGPNYLASVPIVRIMVLGNALVFINFLLINLMVVVNRSWRHAVNEGICFAACAVLTWILGGSIGMAGAAWALVLTETILMGLTLLALWSERGFLPEGRQAEFIRP